MDGFFTWLTSNNIASTIFIIAMACVVLTISVIYIIAFRQNRSISFWPPRVGPRPQAPDNKQLPAASRPEDLKKLFALDGSVVLTTSTVNEGGKPFVRDSDSLVSGLLAGFIADQVIYNDTIFSIERPASHLIVLGSTRYNPSAEMIQKFFDLPYEYVFGSYDSQPGKRVLKIITRFGEELISSSDLQGENPRLEIDYGILFCGNLSNKKRIFWISGIHGYGTVGVFQYLQKNAAAILTEMGNKENTGTSRLLRITYNRANNDHARAIQEIELLGKPVECGRYQFDRLPRAVICDLGDVVMYFDRTRTYRAIAHFVDEPAKNIKQRIEKSDLRERFETGQVDEHKFLDALSTLVGDKDQTKIEKSLLSEFWSDIFWPNYEMFYALQNLKRQNIALVLLSNTNSLHFQIVKRDYPEVIDLFERLILSYEEKRAKPDQVLFSTAISAVLEQCKDVSLDDILFVDDQEEYVQAANKAGIHGFVFRSYPHFVFWLRKKGLYIP